MNNRDRVKQLEDAIRKHRDGFPDEPLSGELELWNVLDNEYEGNEKMNEEQIREIVRSEIMKCLGFVTAEEADGSSMMIALDVGGTIFASCEVPLRKKN